VHFVIFFSKFQVYFIYTTTILLLNGFNFKWNKEILKNNVSNNYALYLVCKSLVVSSFGKLIVVPLVIWNPNEIYFNLAFLFTQLSNSKALTGN
jgi:hypothetical protein